MDNELIADTSNKKLSNMFSITDFLQVSYPVSVQDPVSGEGGSRLRFSRFFI